MIKNLTISKLDASRRQLETAIRLYFSNGDPVSIHSLTAAAYNVIRDLNIKRGGEPLLVKDKTLDLLKPEYVKSFRAKVNQAENFFKHADRDHEETLEFNPDQSEMLILDACSAYYKMSGEEPPLFKLYRVWFMANHNDLFNLSAEQYTMFATAKMSAQEMGREGYFNNMLPIMMGISK